MGNVELMIELFVSCLLAVSIFYCVILDRRLRNMKNDEGTIRSVIKDLQFSTDRAEKSIQNLRSAVLESSTNLGDRLRAAEYYSTELQRQIVTGGEILSRINKIVSNALEPLSQQSNFSSPSQNISHDKKLITPNPTNDISATDYYNNYKREKELKEDKFLDKENNKYDDMFEKVNAIASKTRSSIKL